MENCIINWSNVFIFFMRQGCLFLLASKIIILPFFILIEDLIISKAEFTRRIIAICFSEYF